MAITLLASVASWAGVQFIEPVHTHGTLGLVLSASIMTNLLCMMLLPLLPGWAGRGTRGMEASSWPTLTLALSSS